MTEVTCVRPPPADHQTQWDMRSAAGRT